MSISLQFWNPFTIRFYLKIVASALTCPPNTDSKTIAYMFTTIRTQHGCRNIMLPDITCPERRVYHVSSHCSYVQTAGNHQAAGTKPIMLIHPYIGYMACTTQAQRISSRSGLPSRYSWDECWIRKRNNNKKEEDARKIHARGEDCVRQTRNQEWNVWSNQCWAWTRRNLSTRSLMRGQR